ncbi:: DUF3820 [Gemmataceae bacterium]|nr:: DUF3820 [Gemmataceae bacterium]VTU01341.1 : DUF3820 [Gemmataceae bacterium]
MFNVPAAAPPCNGAAGDFVLPFGRHRGQRLTDVPADYLQWVFDSPRTSAELKQIISAFREIDVDEDATEPEPTTAATALPLVTWLWEQEVQKRHRLDDAARKVVADGLAVLKQICSVFTRKPWAEGGTA